MMVLAETSQFDNFALKSPDFGLKYDQMRHSKFFFDLP